MRANRLSPAHAARDHEGDNVLQYDAPGGAYNYVINGRMIAGFAMVAYPPSTARAA